MKKIFAAALSLVLLLGFAACANEGRRDESSTTTTAGTTTAGTTTEEPAGSLEGPLTDILERIYEGYEGELYMLADPLPLVKDPEAMGHIAYFVGVDNFDFTEAVASEPMMMSQAYSLVLVRVSPGEDVEQVKKDIASNADPRKWICVGVDPSDVKVDSIGDVVILIMAEDSDALLKAFKALDPAAVR